MPKINVYVPDALADAVREAGIPVSTVCQRALEDALRASTALREGARTDLPGLPAGIALPGRGTARLVHALDLAFDAARTRAHGSLRSRFRGDASEPSLRSEIPPRNSHQCSTKRPGRPHPLAQSGFSATAFGVTFIFGSYSATSIVRASRVNFSRNSVRHCAHKP